MVQYCISYESSVPNYINFRYGYGLAASNVNDIPETAAYVTCLVTNLGSRARTSYSDTFLELEGLDSSGLFVS